MPLPKISAKFSFLAILKRSCKNIEKWRMSRKIPLPKISAKFSFLAILDISCKNIEKWRRSREKCKSRTELLENFVA